ncbi:T9SS type A sorting domain-containing protein [Fluviicola taffensis]|uniref:Secretion system C-terminal sorting domain-containing protein n=1 Tax=Fluviicola taffensis (strain DSM 16823 / NCIMB 13979 / RW262) TaxID=755732 RepID=F2IIT2_FLUTR|nr:T9SS type A sorting domain-containing protein [Fluviicola taffensis]AEA42789.1 hypothetical protein Fluta_0785 [Fluviicola taffensis DSM 16823]
MKQTLLILFTILSLSAFSQSTNWIKGHGVWHYDWFYPGIDGSMRIETMNDTVIQGHTCQKLKCDKHTKMNTDPNGGFVHLIDTEYKFIYFEQDTVWFWNANQFKVLYDFTAAEGQSRLIDVGVQNQECNDSSYILIDTVYNSTLNGVNVTLFQTRDSSSNSIQYGGLINSHFGMMDLVSAPSHFLFPVTGWCSSSPNDGIFYKLRCFQDDSLTYNPGNVDCEYYTYLSLNESELTKVSVFPNPSSGMFELSSEIPLNKIRLVNLLGSVLREFDSNVTSQQIDLSDLPQGTYYLNIENSNGEHLVKALQLLGR